MVAGARSFSALAGFLVVAKAMDLDQIGVQIGVIPFVASCLASSTPS
jgi:hypothetical protein